MPINKDDVGRTIDTADIRDCYKELLNREPESVDVVARHLASHPTLGQFLRRIRSAPEFVWTAGRAFVDGLRSPQLYGHVDVGGTQEQLDALMRHTRAVWAAYGEKDAYYSVLTDEKYGAARIGPSDIQEFYATGASTCQNLLAAIRRNGISVDPKWTVAG